MFGALRQVDGIFFQRLALLLGAGVIHLLPAAHLLDRPFDRTLGGTRLAQYVADLALVLEGREHEELAGYIGVVALLGDLVGNVEQAP